nr:aminotransferase class I/II-fold pyridoxal phosphate-dependent enzyme [Pseudenhygromyxa sp. WMMC2535]
MRYRLDGREVVSFCSNDYLGIAGEALSLDQGGAKRRSEPGKSAVAGCRTITAGTAASRLVCGDLPEHRALERRFASFIGMEDAVLFPSGFQANASVPASLLRPGDAVYSDVLNHASLIDGLRLSPGERKIIEHLQRPQDPDGWWFCESVFSMDGDGPAIAALEAHLAEGGKLYLDEAHALGLYTGGRGRAASLTREPTVLIAPLGKAMGCAGAFVCASRLVCDWIRGHARGFVFSTGVSPVLVQTIDAALDRIAGREGDERRAALWRKVERFRARLSAGGIALDGHLPHPIHPILIGPNERASSSSARLLERGWHVQAIRPPTVPEGSARLRVTLSAAHEDAEIDGFADDLIQELKR